MGSVKEEITRLETAKKDIETAIETCGVNVPDTELIDTYASYIRQIPSAVFSGLNVDPVGGVDQFIQSIKQTNGLIEATVGGLVSTSNSGLVPKADGNAGVINSPSDDYVLTYKGGTVDWYKLPANAFKNDDNNTTYTLSGALNGNAYDVTLTPSSGSATGAKVPAMGAASSSAAGTAGLVPAPAKNKHNSFLRGDGTWVVPDNTTYSVMTGATASAAGKAGLVPQPAKGDQGKFLSGAGTWTSLPSLSVTDSESGNAVTDVEVSGHGITLKRGTTFSVNGHKHSSDDITALTSYIKATTAAAIASTDSLNSALGKLELKADTAYNLVKGAYDGDGTIENLAEILKVLEGISDTDTIQAIIGKYLPLAGGMMTGNITFDANRMIRWHQSDSYSISCPNTTNAAYLLLKGFEGTTIGKRLSVYKTAESAPNSSYNLYTDGSLYAASATFGGPTTITGGSDLNLQANSTQQEDAGDIVFKNYSGTELGRIWLDSSANQQLSLRYGAGDATKRILHSGNSSVSKSGQTLTVKINGVEQSITNSTYSTLPNPYNISFKDTSNSTVTYNGSSALDLTGGIYYAVTSSTAALLTKQGGTSTAASVWNPKTSWTKVWGQNFVDSSISSDTGDILYYLRASEYGSGTTELCMVIDGDYYAGVGQYKVWHAGNLTKVSQLSNDAGYLTSLPSHVHTYIQSKDNYTFTASTLPNSFDWGVSAGFVADNAGYGSYGSVLTVRTYTGGGGTLQLYAPYSKTYGGTRLKARFGDYDKSNGNSWTDLKEIAWTSDIPTKTSQLTNDSGYITSYTDTAAGKTFKNLSSVSHSGWTNNTTDDKIIPTMSFIAYWNGAYSSTGASNLVYCANGTIIGSNNIGSQSVAYATSAGNANTVGNYPVSSLWRSDGAVWNPSANVTMTPTANNQEWSFDFRNKGSYTGSYWHVWDESKNTLLRVDADSGAVSAPYGFVGNLTGVASNATNDVDGNAIKTTYLRQVVVPNNTTNDFNTFENLTLTGRVDPTTGASLVNAPWTGGGPAGGYGVLTYLFNGSGYGTQMAWGYNSNRIYIRPKYYSNGYKWATTWDSLALTSDLKNPTDYYWANVPISATSSSSTSPTFANATTTGLLTVSTGGSHCGIKAGSTYINSINSDLILQNNGAIRFGGDSWDYNVWAGLKYVHSSKTISLGLADGTHFTANSAQSGGTMQFPGISNFILNGTVRITPQLGNYQEGIRIQPKDSWSILMLLGTDTTAAAEGTSAKSWGIFNNDGNFYINRGGSSTHTGYELCNISGNWGIKTNSPENALDVNGVQQIYQRGNDNTAFKNLLLLKQQNSTELSQQNWDTSQPSFGIGFRRYWTSGSSPYGETTHAGIYSTVASNWRGGLVFRTKNNETQGGTHDTTALRLRPDGHAIFGNSIETNGSVYINQPSSNRRAGIIGTYDANRAAAIWSMGSSYQIAADGTTLGNLYGAAYVYYGSGYTFGAGKSQGHSFVWCQNGTPYVALGNNIWTGGGLIVESNQTLHGLTSTCNAGNDASYTKAAMQIREYNFGGAQSDTWAIAPRLAWHWSGRVQAQIGLASDNHLYISEDGNFSSPKLIIHSGNIGSQSVNYATSAGSAAALSGGSIATWGTLTAANGYTNVCTWDTGNTTGAFSLAGKGGQMSLQLDGFFYQNEGRYLVLDTGNWSSYISIPSVGNGTVTINQAGASKGSFTLNQSTAATINLTDTNYYPTAFSWTGGTTSGPTGSLTGTGMTAVSFGAIPSASGSASGIVTTGAQTFAGEKTFHQIRLRQPSTSGSVNYGGYLYFGDGSYAYIAELSDDELYYHASGGHYFEGLNHNFAPVLVGTIYRKPGETTYSTTSNSIGIDSSSGATKNIGISVSKSRAGKYAVTLTNNTSTTVRIHAPVITSSHGDWGGGSCYESPFAYLDHNSTCVFPKSIAAGKTLSFNIICGRIHTQGSWSTGDFTKSDDNSGFICSIYASYSGNLATG